MQLRLLPALPLQHEGEHGDLRGGGEGELMTHVAEMWKSLAKFHILHDFVLPQD